MKANCLRRRNSRRTAARATCPYSALSLAPDGRGAIAAPSVWSQARSPGQPLSSTSAGQWRDDDYDEFDNGVVVGRIFFLDAVGPSRRPWMWASGHDGQIKRAAQGYAATREEAMAAFAESWRRNNFG